MIDQHLINRAAAEFSLQVPARLTQSRSGLTARSIAHAVFVVGKQHTANLKAASSYTHPDVAPHLLPELRMELIKALQSKMRNLFDNALDGFKREGERALDAADKAADVFRPHLDGESPAQLLRTDQAWNNTIRPALEQGKTWEEIIPTVDADGLLAIERFAEGHESRTRDRFHQNEVPSSLAGIRSMTARRVIEVAPAEGREALAEYQDVSRMMDFVGQWRERLVDAGPRDAVGVDLGLIRSGTTLGVHRPVDTSPEAQAAYTGALPGADSEGSASTIEAASAA